MSSKRRLQYPGEICRPDERIVERISVELFRRAYVPSVDFAAAQELEKLIRPMKMPPAPRAIPPPDELTPTLVQEIKNMEYKNFTVALDAAVIDEPLGIRDMGIVADTMTIVYMTPGLPVPPNFALFYKINRPSNDETPGREGQSETEFAIEEIYVRTPVPVGTPAGSVAIIRVNWNPFLIRVKP